MIDGHLILGLISLATAGDEGAGISITVFAFLLGAAATAAAGMVISRVKAKAKANGKVTQQTADNLEC